MKIKASIVICVDIDGEFPDKDTLENAFFGFFENGIIIDKQDDKWALILDYVSIENIEIED